MPATAKELGRAAQELGWTQMGFTKIDEGWEAVGIWRRFVRM